MNNAWDLKRCNLQDIWLARYHVLWLWCMSMWNMIEFVRFCWHGMVVKSNFHPNRRNLEFQLPSARTTPPQAAGYTGWSCEIDMIEKCSRTGSESDSCVHLFAVLCGEVYHVSWIKSLSPWTEQIEVQCHVVGHCHLHDRFTPLMPSEYARISSMIHA